MLATRMALCPSRLVATGVFAGITSDKTTLKSSVALSHNLLRFGLQYHWLSDPTNCEVRQNDFGSTLGRLDVPAHLHFRSSSGQSGEQTGVNSSSPDGCVCGLNPCMMPWCAASSWDSWDGTFVEDDRSLAPYQGTPHAISKSMLELAELSAGETFIDLGAGDGRVMLHALIEFRAGRVLGWELDPAVHALGQAHIKGRIQHQPNLATKISLIQGDARQAELAEAHVVAIYLLPKGHKAMQPHLEQQLPLGCGTRVVAHQWPIPSWDISSRVVTKHGTTLYLYRR
ncbi:hypothetical protein CYMTET_16548 [Cymbomonas tetramitiformis]|uniref:DOT1 domain-containing protein n=1 Tax=Cymbomonas tetramitiformis TaxID=36881 RepID=A0AAE0L857_9CHLO|nr:hypothetical protein CYMTET_16548 [Cymbomonas tetramitiformis]